MLLFPAAEALLSLGCQRAMREALEARRIKCRRDAGGVPQTAIRAG